MSTWSPQAAWFARGVCLMVCLASFPVRGQNPATPPAPVREPAPAPKQKPAPAPKREPVSPSDAAPKKVPAATPAEQPKVDTAAPVVLPPFDFSRLAHPTVADQLELTDEQRAARRATDQRARRGTGGRHAGQAGRDSRERRSEIGGPAQRGAAREACDAGGNAEAAIQFPVSEVGRCARLVCAAGRSGAGHGPAATGSIHLQRQSRVHTHRGDRSVEQRAAHQRIHAHSARPHADSGRPLQGSAVELDSARASRGNRAARQLRVHQCSVSARAPACGRGGQGD